MSRRLLLYVAIACMAMRTGGLYAAPLSPAFLYQGRLRQDGAPVTGTVHLRFSLWDAAGAGSPPAGGNQLGASQLIPNVAVTNGLFTVTLNGAGEFGPNAFNAEARWLGIEVCADPNCVSLTILSPRQPLTAAPYALHAISAPHGHSLDAADGDPVDAVFVDNSGRVGIGTASPATLLDIIGATPFVRVTNVNNIGPSLQLANTFGGITDNIGTVAFSMGAFGTNGSSRAEIRYANNLNESVRFSFVDVSGGSSSTVERMRITKAGSVGIGTASPAAPLHVTGSGQSIEIAGANGALKTNGFVHREYTVSTPSVAIPIAYGSISTTGTINGGTGNFTVSHPAAGQYDITVNGETYSNNTFTVTITPVTNSPRITGVADAGAGFRVNMWNLTGTLVDNAFHFTIWTANPANPG